MSSCVRERVLRITLRDGNTNKCAAAAATGAAESGDHDSSPHIAVHTLTSRKGIFERTCRAVLSPFAAGVVPIRYQSLTLCKVVPLPWIQRNIPWLFLCNAPFSGHTSIPLNITRIR
jgi:hypothetical protein